MKTTHIENKVFVLSLLAVLMFVPATIFAQGNGGGGSSSSGDQDQTRDQDRVDEPQQDRDQTRDQDCLDGVECEPIQDRDQVRDQDQLQDSALSDDAGPDRVQDRDQDCLNGVDCEPTQDRDRDRLQIYTPDELRTAIQEQQRLVSSTDEGFEEKNQNIYRNQNQVRVAAMALASSSDLLGDIGPVVSQIAKELDNSVQASIQTEQKIQNRSGFMRFFFGSDDKEVANLNAQVEQNNNRVQELNRMINAWNGDSQIQAVLQEQIRNMEQEQQRLQSLVDEEKQSRGLFGFLFGWL